MEGTAAHQAHTRGQFHDPTATPAAALTTVAPTAAVPTAAPKVFTLTSVFEIPMTSFTTIVYTSTSPVFSYVSGRPNRVEGGGMPLPPFYGPPA